MRTVFLFIIMISLFGTAEAKRKKVNEEEYQQMKSLVLSNEFKLDLDYAYPSGARSISLFSNRGTIKINHDNAEGTLPYFGRAYSLPYGEGGGIKFDGPMKERKVSERSRRKTKYMEYKFTIQGDRDVYDVAIEIYAGGSCTVAIISNNRSTISYSGKIYPLDKDNE